MLGSKLTSIETKWEVVRWLTSLPLFGRAVDRLGRSGTPIFTFHRVLPEDHIRYDVEMVTSNGSFASFLEWVSDRYRVTGVKGILDLIGKPSDDGKPPCAITFDDGWRDTYLHAFPLLQRHHLTATVFLCVRFIGTNRRCWQEKLWYCMKDLRRSGELESSLTQIIISLPWCPRLSKQELTYEGLRRLLMRRPMEEAEEFASRMEEAAGPQALPTERAFMNWEEVREMQQAGIEFGSHTLNHTLLTLADPETARQEIETSRRELEEHLGSTAVGFSYPWGGANRWVRAQVKAAGYQLAVTTTEGLVRSSADPWLLPRLHIGNSVVNGPREDFSAGRARAFVASRALRARGVVATSNGESGTERLRLALVIDSIDKWQGGTEQQLGRLLATLDRRYFDPGLYFLRPSAHLTLEEFSCPVHLAGLRPEVKWYRLSVLSRLVRLLRQQRPHIVQTFFRDGTYYGTLASGLARVPVIVHARRNAGHWRNGLDRTGLKLINHLADAWQCNSRSVAEGLKATEGVPADRTEILPNAIDLDRFSPPTQEQRLSARRQLGLSLSAPVFIEVANLTPVKDPGTLVEAATHVHQLLPSAQFLVVGEGSLRSGLTRLIEARRLTGSVQLLGCRSDVRPFLAAADIGLLTSKSEGSSNSVLEYMAMGLPAVLSDIPSNRELVNEVFFVPGDSGDLGDKILRLYGKPDLRARMSREYRQRAVQYGLEAFAPRAQTYYFRLAAEFL